MRNLLSSLIISFAVFAIASPSFAGDDRDDRKWDRDKKEKSHYSKEEKHHKNKNSKKRGHASLVVKIDGVIGEGAPCPHPRHKTSYSTIQAAVDCARNGDTIRVLQGVFDGATLDKNLTILGLGPNKTLIITSSGIFADVILKKVTISDSSGASDGGGLETVEGFGARLVIEDCILVNNLAHDGGAIKINSDTEVKIKNSVLSANKANGPGGAITNEGKLILLKSVIAGNTAEIGAGIYNRGTLIVSSSLITRNDALSAGGGIFNDGGTVVLRDSPIITLNTPEDCVGCQ